jgi:bacillithiol system protein YtxJ
MSFHWIPLHHAEQLDEIKRVSAIRPQIIFKHSTRCSISSLALRRFEQHISPADADFHFLDLIAHRDISAEVARVFDVWHESPQILMISEGECTYDESHLAIDAEEINQMISQKTKG